MTVPLWILACGSVVVGYLGLPAVIAHGEWNWIHHYLGAKYGGPVAEASVSGHVPLALEWALIGLSSIIAIGVFVYARKVYLAKGIAYDTMLQERLGGLYRVWQQKYNWDEVYNTVMIDGLIGTFSKEGLAPFDSKVVDGLVNGIASLSRGISAVLRRIQTGVVQNYALALVVGVVVVLGVMMFG
jgi:NADH-quinone oxidoreductase subunit L